MDKITQTCTNTVGGYTCTNNAEELVGIGYGGQTSSGSEYRAELIVVSEKKDSCGNHVLPALAPGRFSPGSAVIGSRLYICGGNYLGKPPSTECKYIDMNSYNPSWLSSTLWPQQTLWCE